MVGTTSACAENTTTSSRGPAKQRNYLRVRGEYRVFFGDARPHQELPPRARRILITILKIHLRIGTTSACAENTPACVQLPKIEGNYLRVRGEYQHMRHASLAWSELPPRARRILTIT